MNNLIAQVKQINSVDNLNIITLDFNNIELKVMTLELKKDLKINSKVVLNIKSTQITLCQNINSSSISNELKGVIESIEVGELLACVKINTNNATLESIVSKDYIENSKLKVNDKISVLIKASELAIMEIIK